MTVSHAVVAMVVLAVAGALPTVALAGFRWLSVPAAPLAGAVLAALASAGCLAVGGTVLFWFVLLSAVAAAVSAVGWWRAHPAGSRPKLGSRPATGPRPATEPRALPAGWAGPVGLITVVAASAWMLTALRAPSIGFDARAIWLLHADWLAAGHQVALGALRNPAVPYSHDTYPPLPSGSVAVVWMVTGDHGYRLGQVVVALLNSAAVATAALATVEVGRRVAAVAGGATHWAGHRTVVPAVAGVVAAGALVLAAFGVAGRFGTNGLADLLWSAAATGAIAFGLVLPGRGRDLGMAVLLLAVAGLTKDEGIAIGMAIAVLITLRRAWSAWRSTTPTALAGPGRWPWRSVPWKPLAAGGLGVLALGAWPVLMRVLGSAPALPTTGSGQGGWFRFRATYDAMVPYLHDVPLAVALAVVGGVFLRRTRRAAGVGNDGWSWAAFVAGTGILLATYVTGTLNIQLWLLTSINRTVFFPELAVWWIVATWAVVAVGQVVAPLGDLRTSDPPPGPQAASGPPVPALSAGRGGAGGTTHQP